MKTTHASLLAVVSLSLALCACDSGDKKNTSSAPPTSPPKTPKAEKAESGAAKVNPQAPESTETPKDMNAPGVPAAADAQEFTGSSQVDQINGAISTYAGKQMQSSSMKQMAGGGQMNKKDAQGNYPDPSKQKSASSGGVTSLDQLVTSGILKSIPAPPEGKKYVLDVKAQKVRLENK